MMHIKALIITTCAFAFAHLTEGRTDKCGCVYPKGWSMKYKKCKIGSITDQHDDCIDRCGCKYPQGWSSAHKKCQTGKEIFLVKKYFLTQKHFLT